MARIGCAAQCSHAEAALSTYRVAFTACVLVPPGVCEVPQLPLKGLKQAGLGDGNSNLQAQLLAVRGGCAGPSSSAASSLFAVLRAGPLLVLLLVLVADIA